ncbi:M1 family metallopeptidase [Mucilaginibacter rubeus]|uniref:M1 family metallopeptidase n=1 Tax=Mucilaginibacter rubeus TaxID=2027860 RepID=A0AAE6JBD6_9SPHI|nr:MULTISPECIES: M1 family metallopeptidase [Mucilaginibacter]QEM02413.1 M1 family metallopeptidase [Mucilaginibacter rubeus]QEM15037.1 M1 family metallopeptidase [Mucilaginibacter gossypii]QTE42244.1 M1 family metallopeptidase [Mucilaginibacter rubeus]QTE48846.1 M1 family metallopeptidase [Mucilaginibacter rubeus]QTE53943.1 M1 family metallopeptidase [Mucilaginibacter rubeus]
MTKPFILSALACIAFIQVKSQTLYMPRDIQKAFKNETRSADGRPGKKYWQNYGRYNISITAVPQNRTVKGTEQITYVNNSPDTLKRLNMKLILNIHKPGAARFGDAGADYLTPGIQFDSFSINGEAKKVASGSTNQMVGLSKPLIPHDSVKLDIGWHFEISKESGREGMIDSTTCYLAYFYPRVSVYDDYNGWDRLPFLDAQEFYNDFNDYTLHVAAPKNYVVWATGTLQNPDEVLQPEYAKRLKASFTSDSTINIASAAELAAHKVTAQKEMNTWTWTANDISDMAVGISDHYVWDAASVVVDDATNRRASMQAAFLDSSEDFHHAVQNGRNSLSWLSHNWPGVPYPFPKMTSFQGFADMEYPMMVNDSHTNDVRFSQFVQDHEIAHTYFPFYMGINESRYAFMDEGWATTFELLIGTSEVGKEKAEALYKNFRVDRWIHDASTAEDQPVITPSSELRGGYGNNSYGKPSLSYLALKDMLGDQLFKKALHGYMDRWHGKHPIPWDYFNSMSNITGKNLDWFFNNWFFTNYYIDLSIKGVTKAAGGYTVAIKNVGGFVIPFDVKITYADGSGESIHQTPVVWEKNQKQIAIDIKTTKTIKSVTLDGGIFMDADESNNTWNR